MSQPRLRIELKCFNISLLSDIPFSKYVLARIWFHVHQIMLFDMNYLNHRIFQMYLSRKNFIVAWNSYSVSDLSNVALKKNLLFFLRLIFLLHPPTYFIILYPKFQYWLTSSLPQCFNLNVAKTYERNLCYFSKKAFINIISFKLGWPNFFCTVIDVKVEGILIWQFCSHADRNVRRII